MFLRSHVLGYLAMSTIAFAAADASKGANKPTPIASAPAPTPIPAGNDGSGAAAPAPASANASPTVTKIRADIPPPPKKSGGRGGQTLYDFDKLEIGQSFGVVGKTIKGMASTVSSANKRYTEVVKDTDGNEVVVDGKKATKQTRKFVCGSVVATADDPATVRVWRVALDY